MPRRQSIPRMSKYHTEPANRTTARFTAKLMEFEDGDIGVRIGRKMLEESVLKNVLPVVGIAISARWNYVATRKLAATAKKYIRYRRALADALKRLRMETVTDPAVLVEGAWLLATVDGEPGHEEMMAFAAILDALTDEQRKGIERDKAFGEDEEQWFEDLARAPAEMHDALLDTLYLVAATDKELQTGEKRFLRRVGKVLRRDIDIERIEAICGHLAEGDPLPDGFLRCAS